MEKIILIVQVAVFFLLAYTYYRICAHRQTGVFIKVAELVSLSGVTLLASVCRWKFVLWVLSVVSIGAIKVLTSKKKGIETRNA